jgi:tetratricopeptide (TPR) repeat protein
MNETRDPNETRDEGTAASGTGPDETTNPTRDIDLGSLAAESLDVGLAAAFGKNPGPARSSIGDVRPVLLKEADGESALVVRPTSDAMPSRDDTGDRYRLDGEIARGGMGAVLRGRDVDLGRDLAVKVLLEKFANRPDVARRFIEEAQICGQLQHPGIVPVYDIGKFGDRPFFTMKLVKGQTLAAILAERADPSADRPRLLGIALQVAHAMAYAHAKGVIHRDLKPANIMVGAFGEVQVMDWGLAKVLAEGVAADEERASRAHHQEPQETVIRTARSTGAFGSSGTDTEAGSVLGTPAYMPPEQASGDIPHLDRRADVFALGAILCEILTGKPPYVGRSSEEVRRKAANGDLADATARLEGCGADPELVALTKQCLSSEAIDRPKDAQVVVDALTSYLGGVQERLQRAERERAVAEAREHEERKRRKVQLALAASVLAMMLGIGAFAFWRNEQVQLVRQRDARNAEAVAALLGQAEESLRAGDAAKAAVALEAAKKRLAEGGAEKEAKRLGRLDADLALLRELDAVDQFRWTLVDNKWPDPAAVATRTRDVLKRFGADPDNVSVDDAAVRVSASEVRDRIVPALDRLLLQEKSTAVRAVLGQVDADPYREVVREMILAGDRPKVVELVGQHAALDQPPGFVAFLGQNKAIPVERQRQLLQAAVNQRPGDLSLLMTLGGTYEIGEKESVGERLRWYQAALAAVPANFTALLNLGIALMEKSHLDEAIACFKKAIELDRKNAMAYSNLGSGLYRRRQLDEAIACFKKAIELDPKLAIAHSNLGVALRANGRLDEAIACHKKAVELDPKLPLAHANLGFALRDKGQWDEATPCFKKAIELDMKTAQIYGNLGWALQNKGQLDEAIVCYKKAIELDPKDAKAHSNLGGIFCDFKRDYDGAIVCYKKAIELDPTCAPAHSNLGVALRGKGKLDEAIACFKKAIELDPKLAIAHCNLGDMLYQREQLDEAIACYKKAVELDSKDANTHAKLGNALNQKGEVNEAIAHGKTAIELDPKRAPAHTSLGYALYRTGQLDEAVASLKAAILLDPKLDLARNFLATAERLIAARDKLPLYQNGTYTPSNSDERLALGEWCLIKKLYHAAAGLYAAAFAADPKLADDLEAGHRYNAACYAAQAAVGQGDDAAKLDDAERTRLRKQALDWLRADLALRTKRLETGNPADRAAALQALRHWQQDTDLAGIRQAAALAKLPADEQKGFAQLWADVAALLKKAEDKPK